MTPNFDNLLLKYLRSYACIESEPPTKVRG